MQAEVSETKMDKTTPTMETVKKEAEEAALSQSKERLVSHLDQNPEQGNPSVRTNPRRNLGQLP